MLDQNRSGGINRRLCPLQVFDVRLGDNYVRGGFTFILKSDYKFFSALAVTHAFIIIYLNLSAFINYAGGQHLGDKVNVTRTADAPRLGIADGIVSYFEIFRCDFYFLNRSLASAHPAADPASFKRRACRSSAGD